MAVDVVHSGGVGPIGRAGAFVQGLPARTIAFVRGLPGLYRAIMVEMRRVTWPSRDDIKKMSILVILLSLGIGAVIALIDFILQQVLVRWIPQIFAGR
jgi:preprotein translocase SecE subunit